jgi:hypothetical protein
MARKRKLDLGDIWLKIKSNKPVTNEEWNRTAGRRPELNVDLHRRALVRWYKNAGVEKPSEELLRRTLRAMAERAAGWDKPVDADLIVPPPSLLEPQARAGRSVAYDWPAIEAEMRRLRALSPPAKRDPFLEDFHLLCKEKFGKAPTMDSLKKLYPRTKPRPK